jgi:hypothetical protein
MDDICNAIKASTKLETVSIDSTVVPTHGSDHIAHAVLCQILETFSLRDVKIDLLLGELCFYFIKPFLNDVRKLVWTLTISSGIQFVEGFRGPPRLTSLKPSDL